MQKAGGVGRVQDCSDVNFTLGAGVDGYSITYDHASGKFVLSSVSGVGISKIQDADDVNFSLGAGVDGYTVNYDHDTGKFVLTAPVVADISTCLLKDGSTTGASAQAQVFTLGVKSGLLFPAADSTSALRLCKADGSTGVLLIDTTNSHVMIGNVSGVPASTLVIRAAAGKNPMVMIQDGDATTPNWSEVGFSPAPTTETIARLGVAHGASGGFSLQGFSSPGSPSAALDISGWHGSTSPTTPCVAFRGWKHNGASSYAALASTELILQVTNVVTALFTVLGGGNCGIGTVAPGMLLDVNSADALTNTVVNVCSLRHASSGTPAAGFGVALVFALESTTTENQSAGRVYAVWSEATHATRKAQVVFTAYDTAEREGIRIGANGSAATIGFLGATPSARLAHVADASTAHAVTDPADSPADADALREDLVLNVVPSIETQLNNLGTKINSILTTLETFGLHATS